MTLGVVHMLIGRHGYGLILSGAENSSYLFHDAEVTGGTFGELKIGQRVTFDEGPDPCESGHRRARNVCPVRSAISS